MHPGQKTSIEVSPDGVKFQVPSQDDYTGTIVTGGVVILIIISIALLRWGPEKFKGLFKKGNGNGKKSESNGNVATDAVQDNRLSNIEKTVGDNYKELCNRMVRSEDKQDRIIEKQGEIGAKIDIILAKVG